MVPKSPDRRGFLAALAAGAAGTLTGPTAPARASAPNLAGRTEEAIDRGLTFLKRAQARDGHWEATGGLHQCAITGLAGLAFLMEGSNLTEGKYSDEVLKAVNWLLAPGRQQPNGLISDTPNPTETHRYMYGHGFASLFLACAHGSEEDAGQRAAIRHALTRAAEFTGKAQTSRKHRKPEGKTADIGGWGYVSAADNANFDEGSVTITQLQALRAAADATVPVSKEPIDKAVGYLEACTTPKGGLIYSYALSGGVARSGEEHTPITAAAVACSFSAGQYKGELPRRWIKFCKDNIPLGIGRLSHDEYQNYYYAQVVYGLGEDRYGEMFPTEPKESWLTWSKYKGLMFPYILGGQNKDTGAWTHRTYGEAYVTAVNLAILQLEKHNLPFYRR